MTNNSYRKRMLKAGVAVPALIMLGNALPALAQETSAPAPDEGETIIVTGTRISSPNLTENSPVTVVNSQDVKLSGVTRTEDLINSLPQVFAGQGSNISNGSTGTATVNLRGLGAERNLVLVNGRRLVPGDPSSSAADLNVIPAAMIKRVDLRTGGASSVYGADAVTGVVNFIMDTDFEGFRLDGQYSFYQHNQGAIDDVTGALNNGIGGKPIGFPTGSITDGDQLDFTAAFGTSFDDGRGHITAYAGYRKIDPILQSARDYSTCGLNANSTAAAATLGRDYNCSGSATSDVGSFLLFDSDRADLGGTFTSTFFQPGPNRTFIGGFTPYNFNPTNYYQRPDERYTAGFFADYEISEELKPYAEFMFMDDRTVAQIAPSGDFGNTTFINCDNPLLSPSQLAIVCDTENLLITPDPLVGDVVVGQDPSYTPATFFDPVTGLPYQRGSLTVLRRNVEGGGRQDDLQHTNYRVVLGMKGNLDSSWSYDAYYQYGRTNFAETYLNDFSVSRLTRALDVVTNPGTGAPICRSALNGSDANCVPYDIFTPGNVTPQAVAYLSTPGFTRGVVSEQVFSASASGDLTAYGIKSPFSDVGVAVAVGAEYRKESLDFQSDIAFQTGDLAGQGAPTLPVKGSFDVGELYGELYIPIITDGFIESFSVTGGYRYSDYNISSGGGYTTHSYKIEGELAPIADLRFRGGYNRAVRAPTVQDLFAPQRVALDGTTDPCAGFVISAADQACLLQGLQVGDRTPLNPASQYNGLIGGNANLTPEIADTYTAGVVFQPTFVRGFSLTVDWFDITIKKAVTGIGADTILDACGQTLDPTFCGLIQRDGAGSLWLSSNGFVRNITQNIGGLSTRGVDVNANYNMDLGGIGTLGLNFAGTWLDELITDTGVTGSFDCVGLYGNVCGVPSPEWRHTARVSLTTPIGLGASVRWRFFDNVGIDQAGPVRPGTAGFKEQNYFDATLTYRLMDSYSFRLGVNNIFDRDPPLTGSQACPAGICNGNTFAQVYDALGRYVFMGATFDF